MQASSCQRASEGHLVDLSSLRLSGVSWSLSGLVPQIAGEKTTLQRAQEIASREVQFLAAFNICIQATVETWPAKTCGFPPLEASHWRPP